MRHAVSNSCVPGVKVKSPSELTTRLFRPVGHCGQIGAALHEHSQWRWGLHLTEASRTTKHNAQNIMLWNGQKTESISVIPSTSNSFHPRLSFDSRHIATPSSAIRKASSWHEQTQAAWAIDRKNGRSVQSGVHETCKVLFFEHEEKTPTLRHNVVRKPMPWATKTPFSTCAVAIWQIVEASPRLCLASLKHSRASLVYCQPQPSPGGAVVKVHWIMMLRSSPSMLCPPGKVLWRCCGNGIWKVHHKQSISRWETKYSGQCINPQKKARIWYCAMCNLQSASIHLILSRVECFHLLDKCQPAASGWCPAKGCNKRKALGKTYDSNRKCRDEAPASVYLPSSRRFPPLFVPHSSTRALTLYYRPVKE